MNSTTLKVLLVEDNAGDAFLIKFYLGESLSPKFDFQHSETVQGALDMLAASNFDIILMDLNLPDSVGLDTIRNVLEKFPNNLVIVLTGLVDEKVGLETVRYGAQDFLVKGKFDGKVLISSIMFAFERFNLNKQLTSVSTELNKGEDRFSNLQVLLNTGYLEVNLVTRAVYLSPHLLDLLNLPADKQNQTIEENISQIEDSEKLIAHAIEVWNKNGINEITFTHRLYPKGPMRLRWQLVSSEKLIGALYPA